MSDFFFFLAMFSVLVPCVALLLLFCRVLVFLCSRVFCFLCSARVLSEHLKIEAERTQRKEDASKKWAVSLVHARKYSTPCSLRCIVQTHALVDSRVGASHVAALEQSKQAGGWRSRGYVRSGTVAQGVGISVCGCVHLLCAVHLFVSLGSSPRPLFLCGCTSTVEMRTLVD